MTKTIRAACLAVFFLAATTSFAQNIDGHWYGIGMMQTTQNYNPYLSEMVLRQKGKNVWGELDYYFKDSLIKVPLNGSFDDETRKLSIKPFQMIYFMSPTARNSIDCYMSGNFILRVSKTESILSGSLFTDADHRYTVPDINYRFVKSNDTLPLVMVDEPEIKKEVVNIPAVVEAPMQQVESAEAFAKRGKIFTKEIEVENNSLKLEIYDNGEIDYDSVSLFLNNKMILPKSMLTHRAIRLTIEIDPLLEFTDLSMFAENLGMIPPNTAALVIYDGKKRYETLLTSDLSKSATIRLRRKK